MTIETGDNEDLRDIRARIIVLETIQNQLLIGAAHLSGAPEAFLQGLMKAAEGSLHEAKRLAAGDEARNAADAIASFNDRSMRLIAALTPSGKPQ